MKLRLGKTYLTREGMEVTITAKLNGTHFPYEGMSGKSRFYFKEDGTFLDSGESEYDILEPKSKTSFEDIISVLVDNSQLISETQLQDMLKAYIS